MFTAVHPTANAETPPALRPARRVSRSCAAAFVIAAALAGCTGGPTAPTTSTAVPTTSAPTASAVPTPSATPTPTALPSAPEDFSSIDLTVPPRRPDALDSPPSEKAAADVATYFALLFPYSAVTHDLRAFEALSHPECEFCHQFIDEVEGYDAKGVRTEGGAIVVHSTDVRMQSDDYFVVTTTMSQDASREIGADGEVTNESEGFASQVFEIDVMWYDGSWLVASVVPT